MIVFDEANHKYELDPPFREGGEGWICRIHGRPGKIAKIYKPNMQTGRETKLRWMIANPPDDPGRSIGHASIAWPEMLLYDGHGSFAGYSMPEITNICRMLNVLNPYLRAKTFVGFEGSRLYRVASNLTTAIGALHARDYIVGDLNESNILVTPQALVTIIDTDSFQVRELREGQIIFYPCPVGRPEFTPPELQNRSFQGEVRKSEQDSFALGVLIFQLLMDGSHPFRATWLGPGDPPPIEERISRGLFPYGNAAASSLVAPPPNYSLDRLHPPLADLMRRCFVDGHKNPTSRPLEAEWVRVLKDAENNLATCPNKHVYSTHLKACPMCGGKLQARHTAGKPPLQTPTVPPPVIITPAPIPPPVVVAQAPVPPPQPNIHTCPICQEIVPTADLYCPACAYPVNPITCRHCGFQKMPKLAKCCPKCGGTP